MNNFVGHEVSQFHRKRILFVQHLSNVFSRFFRVSYYQVCKSEFLPNLVSSYSNYNFAIFEK